MQNRQTNPLHRDSALLPIITAIAQGALVISGILVGSGAVASKDPRIRKWGYRILDDAIMLDRATVEAHLKKLIEQRRLATAIHQVRKRRLVRLVRQNENYILTVTEEGRRSCVRYTLDTLSIVPPKSWDGLWRVVLFDIPEKRRFGRNALRAKLRDLGFLQFQKSAFVLPYPCRDVLDIIIHAYNLAPYVTVFETHELGHQEAKALAYFHLRPKRRN